MELILIPSGPMQEPAASISGLVLETATFERIPASRAMLFILTIPLAISEMKALKMQPKN